MFNVPEPLRAPGQPAATQHVRFYALDDVFPGAGLGAAFDNDASFRAALHQVRGGACFRCFVLRLRGCANQTRLVLVGLLSACALQDQYTTGVCLL